jgi:hypothetical protein
MIKKARDLIPYANRTGLIAVQVEGEGPLILPNGKRMRADHPAWKELDADVELEDLEPAQARATRELIQEMDRTERLQKERAEAERLRLIEEEKAALEAARLEEERRRQQWEAADERRRMKRMKPDKIWDQLTERVRKHTKADAVDMFVGQWEDPGFMNDPDPEGFLSYLETASGDVGMSYEYALDPKSEALYDKYVLLLETGYGPDSCSNAPGSKRQLRDRMIDLYSQAWHSAAYEEWEKAKKSRRWPELLGQKYLGWKFYGNLDRAVKKDVDAYLKKGDIKAARIAAGWAPGSRAANLKTAGHEWEYDRDADFWYLYDDRGTHIGGVGNDNGRYLPYGGPDEDWPIGRGSRDLEDVKFEVEQYLGLV